MSMQRDSRSELTHLTEPGARYAARRAQQGGGCLRNGR